MSGLPDLNSRSCVRCGAPLPESSRADRVTCSMRCHVALWRARRRAADATEEPVRLPSAATVVRAPAFLDDPEVATQLALWLADVAAEAAARDHAA